MQQIFKYLLVVLLCTVAYDLFSQCSMCSAIAESANNATGGTDNAGIAKGLNTSIIYIMIIPYLLLTTLALVFFRKKLFSFWKDMGRSY